MTMNTAYLKLPIDTYTCWTPADCKLIFGLYKSIFYFSENLHPAVFKPF